MRPWKTESGNKPFGPHLLLESAVHLQDCRKQRQIKKKAVSYNTNRVCEQSCWDFKDWPGRQCVSLSMVVAMFLCCTRHCCSSSMELVSWRSEGSVLVKKSWKTSPDWTVLMLVSTYIFAVILKTSVGVDHLTLRQKDKEPMRETYEELKSCTLRPLHSFLPSASAPPLALWAALWWSRRTPGSDGYTSSRSLGHGSWSERPASPWRGHVPDRRTPTCRGKREMHFLSESSEAKHKFFYHPQNMEFFSFCNISWEFGTHLLLLADEKYR